MSGQRTAGNSGTTSIFDKQGRRELTTRVRKVAWSVCYGPQDYDDTVQDMLAWLVEKQAADPAYAENAPSYQVTFAMRRAQDRRRPNRGHDVTRRSTITMVPLDAPGRDDGTAAWYESLIGAEGADQALEQATILRSFETASSAVREAIDKLPAKQRDVIVRRFWLGQKTAQIVRETNMPRGTVCWHGAQAQKALREELAPLAALFTA